MTQTLTGLFFTQKELSKKDSEELITKIWNNYPEKYDYFYYFKDEGNKTKIVKYAPDELENAIEQFFKGEIFFKEKIRHSIMLIEEEDGQETKSSEEIIRAQKHEVPLGIFKVKYDGKDGSIISIRWGPPRYHEGLHDNPKYVDKMTPVSEKIYGDCKIIYEIFKPDFGFIELDGGNSKHATTPLGNTSEYHNYFGEDFAWLNFLGPKEVERIGKEKIAKCPVFRVDFLSDGGAVVIMSPNKYSEKWNDLKKYIKLQEYFREEKN